jgi:hypothetical protein
LEQVFLAVGKAQLRNKTTSYTTDQKMFAMWWFLCCCGQTISLGVCVRVATSRDSYLRAKGRKRTASVRKEEGVGAAREAISKSSRKSVRRSTQQTGVLTTTAWEIRHDVLSMFPYKIQLAIQQSVFIPSGLIIFIVDIGNLTCFGLY